MKTIMITGAARGLGLAIANSLKNAPDVALVLAVRDVEAGRKVARDLGGNVDVIGLDMSSASQIQLMTQAWSRPIFALINNAGLQNVATTEFSDDGVELTLAVNHLGPLQLTLGMLPWLDGGHVMGIGSGTHNPHDWGATRFGFRGGRFSSIEQLARAETEATDTRQAGLDRYATSKLLAMAAGVELGRRLPQLTVTCLDPGLMPGTGLARSAPGVVQMAWNHVLPRLVRWMPGASTPELSAKAARRILLDPDVAQSGGIYDHRGTRSSRVWDEVFNAEFGADVLDQSLDFLDRNGHLPASADRLRVAPGAARFADARRGRDQG